MSRPQRKAPIEVDHGAGGANPEETLEEAAARECREEVGIEPRNMQKLVTFFPNPRRSDWSATVFFCDDYTEVAAAANDPSESVERVMMPIAELKQLVNQCKIIDPSLLVSWHTACAKGLINTELTDS